MTEREIYAIFCKDSEAICRFSAVKAKNLMRMLRKGFGRIKTQCYDYKTKAGTEYKVLVGVYRGVTKSYYCEPFVYCKETNDYYPAITLMHTRDIDTMHYSYTVHFLHRYAERVLDNPSMPINQVFVQLNKDIAYAAVIYQSGDDKVLATPKGIILQRYDRKRRIDVCKTFVSADLLRPSQMKAFSAVADILSKYTEQFHDMKDRDDRIVRNVTKDFLERGVTAPDLFAIYGEYFKNKNTNKQ